MTRAEYMKQYRRSPEGQYALGVQKQRDKARRRALSELADKHVAEFEALFAEHLKRVKEEDKT